MKQKINQEVKIEAKASEVYGALTDSETFSEFTGGAPAEIHANEGGAFSLFGGMIQGRTIELNTDKQIIQAWRAGNWEEGVYSIVRFDLVEEGSQTIVTLHQAGFPEDQGVHLESGWHENYWKPLQNFLSK